MSNTKLTALAAQTAATTDDLLYLVNDPGGTAASKKITFDNLQKSISALTAPTITGGTITGITDLAIADGGTGASSAQAAINALTAVSGATNEHVLTKDTATGDAKFKAAPAGLFTNSTTDDHQTSTTNTFTIGATSPLTTAKVSIDGNADLKQLVIQGHSTQTNNIVEVQKSDGSVALSVSNTAGITVGGTGNSIGSSTASAPLSFTTGTAPKVVALSDGATPALDASLGDVFTLSAAGDRTIAVPSNATSGQKIIIRHLASGGARTLALNTGAGGFRFGSDITALSQTASGKYDYIGCIYNATSSTWDVVAYSKGF